jgi:hypothetical protein
LWTITLIEFVSPDGSTQSQRVRELLYDTTTTSTVATF